jgi:predicted nucleic acid-binding protein
MADYWDTSCLLKLYCAEEDSHDFIALIGNTSTPLTTSKLTQTEIFFAFQQKARRGETRGRSAEELFGFFESDVEADRIHFVPWGEDVFQKARELAQRCYASDPPVFLRSLDGIHLASALLSSCKRIHSTDERIRQAIRSLSLWD